VVREPLRAPDAKAASAAASAESADPEMPLAAVVPTRARAEADAPRANPPQSPSSTKPNEIERPTRAAAQQTSAKVSAATIPPEAKPAVKPVPKSVSASNPTSTSKSASRPATQPAAKAAPKLAAKPAATPEPKATFDSAAKPIAPPTESAEAQSVERVDDRGGLPGVAVLRTSWHPSPERRSTKVRVEATGQVVSLREGDAVGGLIVQEISPSAVVFKSGDVEIRRRVGQP
jgi:hypothetical protein